MGHSVCGLLAEIICKDDRVSRYTSLLYGGKKKKIK